MSDENTNAFAFDRGAFAGLTFRRCERGFTLCAIAPIDRTYFNAPTFAFDRIEDLAAWLVEQYGAANV